MIKTVSRHCFKYAIGQMVNHLSQGHLSEDVMAILKTISLNHLLDCVCIHQQVRLRAFILPYELAGALHSLVGMNTLSAYCR